MSIQAVNKNSVILQGSLPAAPKGVMAKLAQGIHALYVYFFPHLGRALADMQAKPIKQPIVLKVQPRQLGMPAVPAPVTGTKEGREKAAATHKSIEVWVKGVVTDYFKKTPEVVDELALFQMMQSAIDGLEKQSRFKKLTPDQKKEFVHVAKRLFAHEAAHYYTRVLAYGQMPCDIFLAMQKFLGDGTTTVLVDDIIKESLKGLTPQENATVHQMIQPFIYCANGPAINKVSQEIAGRNQSNISRLFVLDQSIAQLGQKIVHSRNTLGRFLLPQQLMDTHNLRTYVQWAMNSAQSRNDHPSVSLLQTTFMAYTGDMQQLALLQKERNDVALQIKTPQHIANDLSQVAQTWRILLLGGNRAQIAYMPVYPRLMTAQPLPNVTPAAHQPICRPTIPAVPPATRPQGGGHSANRRPHRGPASPDSGNLGGAPSGGLDPMNRGPGPLGGNDYFGGGLDPTHRGPGPLGGNGSLGGGLDPTRPRGPYGGGAGRSEKDQLDELDGMMGLGPDRRPLPTGGLVGGNGNGAQRPASRPFGQNHGDSATVYGEGNGFEPGPGIDLYGNGGTDDEDDGSALPPPPQGQRKGRREAPKLLLDDPEGPAALNASAAARRFGGQPHQPSARPLLTRGVVPLDSGRPILTPDMTASFHMKCNFGQDPQSMAGNPCATVGLDNDGVGSLRSLPPPRPAYGYSFQMPKDLLGRHLQGDEYNPDLFMDHSAGSRGFREATFHLANRSHQPSTLL